jgi:uncharacterized protein (DUF697 family)
LLIQLRMISAIAHIRGYKISDERVRTLAFLCLTGSSGATILQEIGIGLGTKLTSRIVMNIPAATLGKINQAVGFRLLTKAGSAGLVNFSKVIPLVGGLLGGGFDAAVTRGIGAAAKRLFTALGDEPSTTVDLTTLTVKNEPSGTGVQPSSPTTETDI